MAPFGLTDSMFITLTGGMSGALAQDQLTGSTTLTANPIPEPASVARMLSAAPLAIAALWRRRSSHARSR
jgi:hypothetical protein